MVILYMEFQKKYKVPTKFIKEYNKLTSTKLSLNQKNNFTNSK